MSFRLLLTVTALALVVCAAGAAPMASAYDSLGGPYGGFGTNGQVIEPVGDDAPAEAYGMALAETSTGKIAFHADPQFGSFVSGTAFTLGRLNADGTVDTGFGDGGSITRTRESLNQATYWGNWIQFADDSSILLNTNPDDVEQLRATWFLPSGAIDVSKGTAGTVDTTLPVEVGQIRLTKVDGSGRVLVLLTGNGADLYLVRLTADLDLDLTFGGGTGAVLIDEYDGVSTTDYQFKDMAFDSLGRIVLAGHRGSENYYGSWSGTRVAVARVTTAGVLDTAFAGDGIADHALQGGVGEYAFGLHVEAGDAVMLVAQQTSGGSTSPGMVTARFTSAGALDTTYNAVGYRVTAFPTAGDAAKHEFSQSYPTSDGGNVLIYPAEDWGLRLLHLTSAGLVDAGYGSAGVTTLPTTFRGWNGVPTTTQLADESIVLTGANSVSTGAQLTFIKVTASGSLDAGFGTGGIAEGVYSERIHPNATPFTILPLAGGATLTTGMLRYGSSIPRGDFFAQRRNGQGVLDSSYGASGTTIVEAGSGTYNYVNDTLAFQGADGKTYMAAWGNGDGNQIGGIIVARLLSDGTPDPTFDGDGVVWHELAADYSIGGGSLVQARADNQGRTRLLLSSNNSTTGLTEAISVRLLATGALDTSFGGTGIIAAPLPDSDTNSVSLWGAHAQGDDWLAFGSRWDDDNSINQPVLIRVTAQGDLDTNFGTAGYKHPLAGTSIAESNLIWLAVDSNTKLHMLTYSDAGDDTYDVHDAVLDANGDLDPASRPGGFTSHQSTLNSFGRVIALDGGRIGILGTFNPPGPVGPVDANAKKTALNDGTPSPMSILSVLASNGARDTSIGNNGDVDLGTPLAYPCDYEPPVRPIPSGAPERLPRVPLEEGYGCTGPAPKRAIDLTDPPTAFLAYPSAATVAEDGESVFISGAFTDASETIPTRAAFWQRYRTADLVAPNEPQAALPGAASNGAGWNRSSRLWVFLSGLTDTGTGVDGLQIEWSQDPNATFPPRITHTGTPSEVEGPPLGDGPWYAFVRSIDRAGNPSTMRRLGPANVDAVAPVASARGTRGKGFVAVSVDASDPPGGSGLAAAAYSFDGGASWETSSSKVITGLRAGQAVQFNVLPRDVAGNQSSTNRLTVRAVDSAPPTVRALFPVADHGPVVAGQTLPFRVTDGGDIATIQAIWQGKTLTFTERSFKIITRLLPSGRGVLTIIATDQDGNVGRWSGRVVIDNVGPLAHRPYLVTHQARPRLACRDNRSGAGTIAQRGPRVPFGTSVRLVRCVDRAGNARTSRVKIQRRISLSNPGLNVGAETILGFRADAAAIDDTFRFVGYVEPWYQIGLRRSHLVAEVQWRLRQLGYLAPGHATSRLDVATIAAVRAFQRANGITELGTVGPRTRRALDRRLRDIRLA